MRSARPMSRRRFLELSLGSTAAVAAGACGDGTPTSSAGAGAATPSAAPAATAAAAATSSAAAAGLAFDDVTISMPVYSRNHASSPLFWQRFAPPGLTVENPIYTNPSDMNRDLQSGALSFALMGAYNTLIERPQGFTSRIIGMVSRRGVGLVARGDAGIDGIDGLAGKRIGVPPPGIQVLILTHLLREAGLALEEDVEPVPLAFADHDAALQAGDVDAYIGTEPIAATSVSSGTGVYLADPYTTPLGDFNTALWASPAMQEQPDLCRAALSMQRDAAEHLSPGGDNDRDRWRDLLVGEFEFTEDVFEVVLDNVGAAWRFDDERRAQVEGAGAAMLDAGVLTAEPDYDDLFRLEYQEELS